MEASKLKGARKAPPKRRKVDPTPSSKFSTPPSPLVANAAALQATKKDSLPTSASMTPVHVAQTSNIDPRIQQAKSYAVAQARQEGCMANFRIFDSPFGNFLVPAIPTRAELGV